jgi:hypothetical protein
MRLFFGDTLPISPNPAAGNPGIKQMMDMIVGNLVAEGMHGEDAHPAGKHPAAGMNMVIGDDVVSGPPAQGAFGVGTSEFYSPRAHVRDFISNEAIGSAAVTEVERVETNVSDPAIFKSAVPDAHETYRAGQIAGGLG